MTRDDTVEFFDVEQEEWRARDVEGLAGRYTLDGTIISPIFKTVKGMDAIRESYRSLFAMFPDWLYTGQQLLVDGDRVSQPFIVSATHAAEFMGLPGTGRKFEIHGVRLIEMRDGLIHHERRYYDFTRFLVELGVLRAKPARPSP
jgi:steroid delta-isomerase-like uncharacterized protein